MLSLKEIEKKADGLRGDEFPIDLVSIVLKVGYKAYYLEDGSDTSGKVKHTEKRIYINPNDIVSRQRFTLAHELGHIVLHSKNYHTHHRNGNDSIKVYDDSVEEIEANKFAGILLMPTDIFKKRWSEYGCIEDIALYFNVSKLAASIRANNLGLMSL